MIPPQRHGHPRTGSLPPFKLAFTFPSHHGFQRQQKRARSGNVFSHFNIHCEQGKTKPNSTSHDPRNPDDRTTPRNTHDQQVPQRGPSLPTHDNGSDISASKRVKREIKVPANFPFNIRPSISAQSLPLCTSVRSTSTVHSVLGEANTTPLRETTSINNSHNNTDVLSTLDKPPRNITPDPESQPDIVLVTKATNSIDKGKYRPTPKKSRPNHFSPRENRLNDIPTLTSTDEDHPITFRTTKSVSSVIQMAMEESDTALYLQFQTREETARRGGEERWYFLKKDRWAKPNPNRM